jgi:hypothetical protein
MAKDYTMRDGKDQVLMMNRNRMGEKQHSDANAFVRKEQSAVVGMAGNISAQVDGKYMDYCSPMFNNGEHAQTFARSLTSGLDKKAYPVK